MYNTLGNPDKADFNRNDPIENGIYIHANIST